MFGGGTKYHLKNIIMPTYSFTGEEERLEIKKKMEMILARLKQGEPFDTVMRRYSSSLEVDGGDLGLFGLDALSPQIQKAVKGLTVGEFTSVLDTDQGYQIFFVSEVVPTKPKPLEEVSSEIENKLFAEKVKKRFELWLKDLREQSHIKIIQ
jgi:peptidyl-prolyl cis-trans isomerase SurA